LQAREHLANERTYLAWLRTIMATMALGLAAAKFGSRSVVYAFSAGGLLVCTAIAVFGYATVRYRTITEEVARGRFTVSSRGPITAAAALVLAVLAALLILLIR
jgi:putative membrane protein